MSRGVFTDSEVDFRCALKSIDESLVSRDIQGLKFLCQDIIPASHQEKIHRGLDLLIELESRGRISFSDTEFLAELLFRIGRLDLVRKLGFDSKVLKATIRERGSHLRPFRVLLQEWIDELTSEEVNSIKFLSTSYVSRNRLEKVKTSQDLFLLLENQEVINERNVQVLIDIANSLERKDLREKVVKYTGGVQIRPPYCPSNNLPVASIPTMVGEINETIPSPRQSQQAFINTYSHMPEENIPVHIGEATEQRHRKDLQEEVRKNLERLNFQVGQIDTRDKITDDIMPCYKMDAKPRGLCLIINNRDFYKIQNDSESRKMPSREGTDIDCNNLEYVFTKLMFKVIILHNLTDTELVRKLTAYSQQDHKTYDCFVCCILSHGTAGKLYGVNGRLIDLKDVTNPFKAISCSTLKGKPKIFFIQACQGKSKQPGVDVQEDSPDVEADSPGSTALLPPETLPNEADFLMGYATLPGFVSYRSKTQGSWYITTLVRMLDKYSSKYDLLSIMIKVNEEVSKATALMNDEFYKQSPAPIPTLRKKIYFR